ncbi:MAG: regulatory protein RecX [Pseudomonadota bacterium]
MSKSPAEPPAITTRRAAMNLLARREHSFHELLQKLTEKFPDFSADEVILPALQQLQDENLQSDERFAEAYVRYRSTRGIGPQKIAAELYSRKLNSDLLKSALYENGPDWAEMCIATLEKKFRIKANAAEAERMYWQRFLLQRGFDQQDIRNAIRTLLSDKSS